MKLKMMRHKAILFMFAVTSTFASPATRSNSASSLMPDNAPDLIVKEIVFDKSPSQIRVRVVNQGTEPSSECYLALQSLVGTDVSLATKQRVWTIPVPALEAGKGFSDVIDVAPLTQTNGPWRATIDRSNTVAESNEKNNTLRYPMVNPGPVPPGYRLPDLVIANFELTDPVHGLVSVEVANKGGGKSGPSTLRLIVWEPGKFEQQEAKTVFVKIRAIDAGQGVKTIVRAAVPMINTKYSMFIDISHEVAESNEDNNRAEGEAGNYKP
jgi:CARDB protein